MIHALVLRGGRRRLERILLVEQPPDLIQFGALARYMTDGEMAFMDGIETATE